MAYNPAAVVYFPTLAELNQIPATAPYVAAYVGGGVTNLDGMGGWYEANNGAWVPVPFAVNMSDPQNGQLIAYNSATGAVANLLNGAATRSAVTASDVNISVTSPPSSIGGQDLLPGDTIFLFGQTEGVPGVENGLWKYVADGQPLARPGNYQSGHVVAAGQVIVVVKGTGTFAGNVYQLLSPSTATIDTTATSWGFFTGLYIPRLPGTILTGPSTGTQGLPESWDFIYPTMLPGYWNGDSAFITSGSAQTQALDRLGRVSDYINLTTPWANHSAINNALNERRRLWLDLPEIYLDAQVSGSWSNRTIYCEAPGQGSSSFVVTSAANKGVVISSSNNVRFQGNLHIRYQTVANNPGVPALQITGSSEVYFERVTLEGCTDGIEINGTVDQVEIGTLVLINWSGSGITLAGSSAGAAVTRVVIRNIICINPQAGAVPIKIGNFVGTTTLPGLIVKDGNSAGGEVNSIVFTGSSSANAAQNCDITFFSGGPTGTGALLTYGQGKNRVRYGCFGAGGNGMTIAATFIGALLVDQANIQSCQNHGIETASLAVQRFEDPTILNCSLAASAAYDGFHADSGATPIYLNGGNISGSLHAHNINMVGANTFFLILFPTLGSFVTAQIANGNAAGTSIIKWVPGFTTGTWT